MRRRRHKKNPGGLSLALLGAGVLGVGAIAFFIFEKTAKAAPGAILVATNGTPFAATPAFTGGMLPSLFSQIRAGDCLTVVQGQAGFRIAGDVPDGQNVAMRAVSNASNGSIELVSIDPRVPVGTPSMVVSSASVDGVGDC